MSSALESAAIGVPVNFSRIEVGVKAFVRVLAPPLFHVRLEPDLQGQAGAVEAALERALLQARDPEDFGVAEALDVAQDDQQAMLGLELGDLVLDRPLE